MNKLQHLRHSKHFLRKMVRYRRNLIRMKKGRPETPEMARALAELEYHTGNIHSYDRMITYLSRKKTRATIQLLIPSNKTVWHQPHISNSMPGSLLRSISSGK